MEQQRGSREPVGTVMRQNGAWLVSWDHGNNTAQDCPANELYTCASSLATAKRVCVEGAKAMGFTGAVRWTQRSDTWWELEMFVPDDYSYEGD